MKEHHDSAYDKKNENNYSQDKQSKITEIQKNDNLKSVTETEKSGNKKEEEKQDRKKEEEKHPKKLFLTWRPFSHT